MSTKFYQGLYREYRANSNPEVYAAVVKILQSAIKECKECRECKEITDLPFGKVFFMCNALNAGAREVGWPGFDPRLIPGFTRATYHAFVRQKYPQIEKYLREPWSQTWISLPNNEDIDAVLESKLKFLTLILDDYRSKYL